MTPSPSGGWCCCTWCRGELATLVWVLLADRSTQRTTRHWLPCSWPSPWSSSRFELGVVLFAGRGQPGLLSAIPYGERMTAREWLMLALALLVVGILGFGLLAIADQRCAICSSAGCLRVFLNPLPGDAIGPYSTTACTTTPGA